MKNISPRLQKGAMNFWKRVKLKDSCLTISIFGEITVITLFRMPGIQRRSGSSAMTLIFMHGEVLNLSGASQILMEKIIFKRKILLSLKLPMQVVKYIIMDG